MCEHFKHSTWIKLGKDKCNHVPTRSPAHIPASSPPVPALTAEVNEDKKSLELEKYMKKTMY